jgi:hypothetical protein
MKNKIMTKIADRILTSGLPLQEEEAEIIRYTYDKRCNSIHTQFRQDDISIWLSVYFLYKLTEANVYLDKNGDEYLKAAIGMKINYEATSATDPDLFMERAKFIHNVAIFSKALKEEFSGEYPFLLRTAAEIIEDERIHIARIQQEFISKLFMTNNIVLRLGSSKTFNLPEHEYSFTIPNGLYDYSKGIKNFSVLISDGKYTVTRKS